MELRKWKLFGLMALMSIGCFAQQTIAPFKTQQANTVFYVNMGAGNVNTTIQKTVTAACAYATATVVDILPGSNPSDTIGALTSACTSTIIFDQRTAPAANYTCAAGSCTLVPYATGTVSTFSATGTNGVAVGVTNPTTSPALTIGLGAITPASVSTATITNTSRTNGDTVATGSGGIQIDGPAVNDIPLLDGNGNDWVGFQVWENNGNPNSFQGNAGQTAVGFDDGGGATSIANQSSPLQRWSGNYWNGSSSVRDIWTSQLVFGSGTNPTTTLTYLHPSGGTPGAASVSFPSIALSAATVTTTATAGTAIALPALPAGYISTTINGTAVKIPYFLP